MRSTATIRTRGAVRLPSVATLWVLLPVLPVAFAFYVFYQCCIVAIVALLLAWLIPRLLLTPRTRFKIGYSLLYQSRGRIDPYSR